jgi:hypothetical protein
MDRKVAHLTSAPVQSAISLKGMPNFRIAPIALQCAMSEDAAQLHLRVEACRRLANKNENPVRRKLWFERVNHRE